MSWHIERLSACPSTNREAASRVAAGAAAGLVVVTDHQTAGRGRLDRVWTTPAGEALTFTAVVDPQVPTTGWPLLPLLVGLAVADGVGNVAASAGVSLVGGLKWPNDVLVEERKLAGILVEQSLERPLALVGVGVNVHQQVMPVPTATSLALLGVPSSCDELLDEVLAAFDGWLGRWRAGEPVLASYRKACVTLGRPVRVDLPGDQVLLGTAEDIDDGGCLVVVGSGVRRTVSAGDVVHVRPA